MPRVKIIPHKAENVIYTPEHWNLLSSLRKRALKVLEILNRNGINCLVYGSLARGDIHANSDIDIVIIDTLASYRLELILDSLSFGLIEKSLIQATPNDIIKVHYLLEDNITLTLPLTSYATHAFEFYHFAGALSYEELSSDLRKPGVDKRLILILPNPDGHEEQSLTDHPYEAKRSLKVSQDIINQRIRVLTQRDKKGRTGVFLHEKLHPSQNVEQKLRELARKNPLIKRRLLR